MTSNQISYATAIEQQRHDTTTEEETNRHNVEMEKLQQASIDLEQDRLNYQNTWESEKNRIQEEYNNKYIEYQYANLETKSALEAELNDITRQKNEMQNQYNMMMADIAAAKNAIDRDTQKELARHNSVLEDKGTWYEQKRAELEKYSTDLDYDVRSSQVNVNKMNYLFNFEFQNRKLLQDWANAQANRQQEMEIWNSKASFMQAELLSNNFLGGLKSGLQIFRPFDWR